MTVAQHVESYVVFSVDKCKDAAVDTAVRHIRGFTSLEGVDRQFDNITPEVFDVKTFMENPQVLVNHDYWNRPDGNKVNAGRVDAMIPARAERVSGGGWSIKRLDDGSEVALIEEGNLPLVKEGDKGLWVECTIMEKGPIELVDQRRLNAFSWSGTAYSDSSDNVKKIDIREVSLVYIPAHPRALFLVGKSPSEDTVALALVGKNGTVREVEGYPEDGLHISDPSEEVPKFKIYVLYGDGRTEVSSLRTEDETDARRMALDSLTQLQDVRKVAVLLARGLQTDEGDAVYSIEYTFGVHSSEKAEWPASYVNDLPDSAFAYVESGEKDEQGKTVPRSKRHFPIKNRAGQYDAAHVRNALARLAQSPFGGKARAKVESAARALGIGMPANKCESSDAPATTVSDSEATSKGGDPMPDAAAPTIEEKLDALLARVDALETAKSAVEEPAEDEGVAEASAKETAEEPAAGEGDAASEEEGAQTVKAMLTEVMSAITGVGDAVKALSSRVETLEKKPAASQQATEQGGLTDTEARLQALRKSAEGLTVDDIRRAKRKALARSLVPEEVLARHVNQ